MNEPKATEPSPETEERGFGIDAIKERLRKPFARSLIKTLRGRGSGGIKYVEWYNYVRYLDAHTDGMWTGEVTRVDHIPGTPLTPNLVDIMMEGTGGEEEKVEKAKRYLVEISKAYVVVTYRITIRSDDGDYHYEATGSCATDDRGHGEVVANAEAQAFKRACAKATLGLHMYYE